MASKPTEKKVIIRASNYINFLKSTIFKSKIVARSEEEIKVYF